MKKKPWWAVWLICAFSILFAVSAYKVFGIVSEAHREKQAFVKLAKIVESAPPAPPAQKEPQLGAENPQAESPQAETPSPYAALKEQNPDFFGWLCMEDTQLNYPVMHTPDDPQHYLHRDFEGETSQSGVPFMDASCREDCGNYLIYGHNMKNGTMFAPLLFYADREYWAQHPTIRFDTLDGSGEYAVLAAFYSEIYPQDARDVFRFYQYIDLRQADDFDGYCAKARKAALYDTGVSAEFGDQLLTLSTCSYHKENGRFVVVARKISA